MSTNSNEHSNPFPFSIEYYVEDGRLGKRERDAIDSRIYRLAHGYRNISGASVALECVSGSNKRAEYKIRVVVYCKPTNIAASRTQDSDRLAVSEALEAIERQVREQRERMRDRHRSGRAV